MARAILRNIRGIWPVLAVSVLAATACLSSPAAALESAPATSSRATVSLVSDTDAVSPGTPFRVGLRFRLAPGWHTYWRNPGDAGVAPELDVTLPTGAKASGLAWPTPQRVAEGPLITYAYTGDVLLPLTVTPAPGPGATTITADARWLVCKDICVPEEASFRLDLPAGHAAPSPQAGLFAAADRRIPRTTPWAAHIAPDGTLWLQGAELTPATVADAWFIPATSGTIEDKAPQRLSVGANGFTLSLKPGSTFKPDAALTGVLAVLDRTGQETDVALQAEPGAAPTAALMPLWRILILAFAGGLILNLMPCVFPVLAMKAIALAAGAAKGKLRAHAVSYTAGVLVAFAAFGGILLAARTAGSASGWGFQFQSPVFVAAMAWLLFGVGLNLSGVFQIGGGLAGAGQGLAGRGGHLGSFFTGLLAVLVATPCTAPFMGAAIAAALAAPPPVTILIFLAMGAGLAAPYTAFAGFPGLARAMPRPGRWMDITKQALAFPMYAGSAWLIWVISQETGSAGVLGTATGLVLVGFAAWVVGVTQTAASQGRRFGQAAAIAAMLAALAVLSGIATSPVTAALAQGDAASEAFTSSRLDALRAAGRPVFVNMTAAWCVTCLVNEHVAIATDTVRQAFAAHDVAYLKGDWTRQDPDITSFLRAHGRDGVPLYVYFPPGHGPPSILPQVLTEATVLAALDHG
jgi:thiol:disulfide interchange protein